MILIGPSESMIGPSKRLIIYEYYDMGTLKLTSARDIYESLTVSSESKIGPDLQTGYGHLIA